MISKHPFGGRKAPRLSEQNKNLDLILRYAALALLYTVFMIAVFAGWMSAPGGSLSAFWALAPIFVWSIRDPNLLPAWMLFAVGVLTDIVIGTPLGAHGLAMLSIAVITRLQQRYLATQGFFPIWIDFAALAFLATALVTLVTVIGQEKQDAWISILSASAMSWAVITIAFPPLSLLSHALVNLVRRFER